MPAHHCAYATWNCSSLMGRSARGHLLRRHAAAQPLEVGAPHADPVESRAERIARGDARGVLPHDGVNLVDEGEPGVLGETEPQVHILEAHQRFVEHGRLELEEPAVEHDGRGVDRDEGEQEAGKAGTAEIESAVHVLESNTEPDQYMHRIALEHVDGTLYLCRPSFPGFLFTFIAVNTSTVVFDRRLLELEPSMFDESLVCFEDVDLWFRFAEHTRFAFIDEIHTIMRKHAASITASNPLGTRLDGIRVRRAHLERLRGRMSPEEVAAALRTISELQFHVAYAQWCAGNSRGRAPVSSRAGVRGRRPSPPWAISRRSCRAPVP